MIIIGSSNGRVGIAAEWAILQAGGSTIMRWNCRKSL